MLKSIYFIFSLFLLYVVCIQGERGEYGSSLAKARFMLAPIAQPSWLQVRILFAAPIQP